MELTRQRDIAQQAANANAAVTVRERKKAEAKIEAVQSECECLACAAHKDAHQLVERILALITQPPCS